MTPEIYLGAKTVATSCQILRLQINKKCLKFDFSWGSAQTPTGGAYRAPKIPVEFKGASSKCDTHDFDPPSHK